jgi:hypothetical protein
MLSLYCDSNDRRQIATALVEKMKNSRENKTMDSPLSESSVTLRLSLIQKRCSELMDEPDALELAPEDGEPVRDTGDPYNHLR